MLQEAPVFGRRFDIVQIDRLVGDPCTVVGGVCVEGVVSYRVLADRADHMKDEDLKIWEIQDGKGDRRGVLRVRLWEIGEGSASIGPSHERGCRRSSWA